MQGRCGWSLTVFHFGVCVFSPHPLKNPSGEGEKEKKKIFF